MKYSVVIVAAGSGQRMKLGYNKVFYKMQNNHTVLENTVRCFDKHESCKEIVVVTQKENFKLCQFELNKPLLLVEGGATRSESVMCGLAKVNSSYVFIHDGARPFVSEKSLDDLCTSLQDHNACILAVPCKDTIKVVENGIITSTPPRPTLYQAQTPQAFKTELLKQAYLKAENDISLTDDASCVEKYTNEQVYIVEGDYGNIKITTQDDLKNC